MLKEKNILIYNASCDFCRNTAFYLKKKLKRKLAIYPNTDHVIMNNICDVVGYCNFHKDVHLIKKEDGGYVAYKAGQAVSECLGLIPGLGFVSFLGKRQPFKAIIQLGYTLLKKYKNVINKLIYR